MKIVIAPDSFKESLSAAQVCAALRRGILKARRDYQIISVPMADGGEGTLAAILHSASGSLVHARARDPLGRVIHAKFGWIPSSRTAVVEMAEASGLTRVPPARRNPLKTSSFGTGELIRRALDLGAKRILLTLGGVATNDAGAGLAKALGYRFLDAAGNRIPDGAEGLLKLASIDASRRHPALKTVEFTAACDVKNPLCGPRGSAKVFGPQKGATPAMIPVIDAALRRFARVVKRDLHRNILIAPGAGAAGGAGAGALAFLNASLEPGVDIVIEALHLERKMKGADFVVTGEGKMDAQTRFGKTPFGVARTAAKLGIPVVAFCGALEAGRKELRAMGIGSAFAIRTPQMSYDYSLKNAARLLEKKAAEVFANADLKTWIK